MKKIETIHLSDYFNVLRKRKSVVIVFLIITVTVTAFLSFMARPVYQATSKMVIDKEQMTSPISGKMVKYTDFQSQVLNFNTHFSLMTSKPVVYELIRKLKLDEPKPGKETSQAVNPIKEMLKKVKANLKLLLRKEQKQRSPEEKKDSHIKSIQGMISIGQAKETRLVTISAKSTDPTEAMEIANTLGQVYIEFDMGSRLDSSKNSMEWMTNELYQLKMRLEEDEKKFHEYKKLNKLFSMQGKQKMIDQKIAEFNNDFLTARNKRLELDAKLSEVDKIIRGGGNITNIRSIINNRDIDTIYNNLTKLELETTRLSKVYKHMHPKMVQNGSEIAKNKKKLKTELEKELQNLKTERAVLLAREQVMEQNIAEFEEDALDASGKGLRFTILQRNMLTSQNLYDTLVSKVKESDVLSSSGASNIRMVELAAVPLRPVSPNKKKNIMLAVLLGIFGGVGVAFFLEYLDQTVQTEDDVVNYLELPVLSIIPIADANDIKGAN
ncbi:MAG: GumC family protein [Desulfobulbaceae bacterium]|nr:GumC family protein [Desulfobulbaceae bacterium]